MLSYKTKLTKFGVVLLILTALFQISLAQKEQNSSDEISGTFSKAETAGKIWTGESIDQMFFQYKSAIDAQIKFGQIQEALTNLRKVAWLEIRFGRFDSALKSVEEAKRIEKKLKDLNDSSQTKALESLILLRKNDLPKSQQILAQIEITEKDPPVTKAIFHYLKAENSYNNRDFVTAQNDYDTSIESWQTANDDENVSYTLIDSGYNLMFLNPRAGIEKVGQALQKFKELGNKRGHALSLITIGVLHSYLDEEQIALNYFIQAEGLFPNDIDFIERARLFNGIGRIYEEFGEFSLSLNYREKAFITFDKGNYEQGQIATLPSLIKLSYGVGNIALADGYYKKTNDLSKKLNETFFLGVSEKYVGDYYFEKEDFASASLHYNKVIAYTKGKHNDEGIIQTENNLGLIALKSNKYSESRNYFVNALKSSHKIQHKFGISETLFNFAKLDQLENKHEEALKNITESIHLTETLYSDVANSNLKRSYFSNVYDRYELYINLLMQKHKESPTENFAIQALQASEKSRSRSLLETLRLSEANFTKDANPELVQKEKELRNLLSIKADKLTELLSSNADKNEVDKVDDERRTLENELENVKADLKQQSPIYSTIKNPPPFDVAEFQQSSLDEKSVLLEFSFGEKESYLWLIAKNEVSSFVLPSRGILENRIEKIRQAFDERQLLQGEDVETYQKRIADLEQVSNNEAKQLSNELFGQVIEKITDKRLIIVPDGKLSLLPISALPFPNSNDYFVQKNEIVYEPSASLLNILPKLQNRNQLPNKDLLVFADPVFDETDNRLTAKNENQTTLSTILGLNLRDFRLTDANGKIPRLFATQTEADSIAEAVGKNRTEILTGFAANREKVLDASISDYKILHFATHGLVDVQRPEVSSIVLSQFAETGEKREGFLRLQDIYGLNLATDLVVLSACQSGIGKEIKGEGLMSLNNAFLQAGAKSVLSSAWKVDDDATAEFMKRFYANLVNKTLTPVDALRQTQFEMINSTQYKSPFYWAAFTVQGEYRQPVSVSKSYFYFVLFGSLGILGMFLVWYFKFSKRQRTSK